MKLRNKKTGRIYEPPIHCLCGKDYETLAEICEEWEDCYECDYWYIEPNGTILQCHKPVYINHLLDKQKAIGNYFETKEEAEKAVEKLKAWKRLKDANFNFKGWKWIYSGRDDEYYVKIEAKYNGTKEDDLDLLFGAKE